MSIPFQVPRRNVGFLWKCCSVKGPPPAFRGEFHALHGVVAGNLGFLSSCMSTWGTCSCLLREVRSPLVLRGAPRDSSRITAGMNRASSRVEAGTSGFLPCSDVGLRVCMPFQTGSQVSTCMEAWNSAFLSNCQKGFRPPGEFNFGLGVLFELATGASELPFWCE